MENCLVKINIESSRIAIKDAIQNMRECGYDSLGFFSMPSLETGFLNINILAIPALYACIDPNLLSELELRWIKSNLQTLSDYDLNILSAGEQIGKSALPSEDSQAW